MLDKLWWEDADPIFAYYGDGQEFYEIYSKSKTHYAIVHREDDQFAEIISVVTIKDGQAMIVEGDQP